MAVPSNLAKRRLLDGHLVLGMGVRQARTPDIGLVATAAGFDYLFLDCEHGPITSETAAMICTAALGQGVTPMVRAPENDLRFATLALDNGAQGIIMPHVSSGGEAQAIATALLYPPLGGRSVSRTTPLVGYRRLPMGEFAADVNQELLLVAMLEDGAAIEAVDEIAAVEGIDVLMVGTNDLCADLGIYGQFEHPRIIDAYQRVIAACHRHGKHPGMAGAQDNALMQRYIGMGVRFVMTVMDVALMIEAGTARTKFLRSLA